MGSTPIGEQTVYMPVVDLLSPLVTLSPRVYQSPSTNGFVFDPLLSFLPDLLFYNTP